MHSLSVCFVARSLFQCLAQYPRGVSYSSYSKTIAANMRAATPEQDHTIGSPIVKASLLHIQDAAPAVKTFTFEVSETLNRFDDRNAHFYFKPGQWVECISLPSTAHKTRFSISSPPPLVQPPISPKSHKLPQITQFQITVKDAYQNPIVKYLHDRSRVPGDFLYAQVGGTFFYKPLSAITAAKTTEKILLIAGGVGIAPLMSMLEFLVAEEEAERLDTSENQARPKKNVTLIYSVQDERDVLFSQRLEELSTKYRQNSVRMSRLVIDVQYFVTRYAARKHHSWDGSAHNAVLSNDSKEIDSTLVKKYYGTYITPRLLSDYISSADTTPDNTVVYMCGPESLERAVKNKNKNKKMPFNLTQLEAMQPTDELTQFMPELSRLAISENAETLKNIRETLADPETDSKTAAGAAMLLAETAKSQEARKPLLEAGVLDPLVSLLRLSAPKISFLNANLETNALSLQILRVLGNMCYDNEDNRDALLEIPGTFAAITKCLDSSDEKLLTIGCGALLNITMDNGLYFCFAAQTQVLEANGAKKLLDIMNLAYQETTRDLYSPSLTLSSLSALLNLVEIEKGIQDILSTNSLGPLFRVLKVQHTIILSHVVTEEKYTNALEIMDVLVSILEFLGENDTIQREIVSQNFLNVLLDFVDHRSVYVFPHSNDDGSIQPLNYTEILKRISRIVTLVTMNDNNMIDIPKHADYMARFRRWMTLGIHTGKEIEEDDIRMNGALCIGNLARSDEACSVLIKEYNVGVSLLELLTMETERVKTGSAAISSADGDIDASGVGINAIRSSVKVIHAVVGAFKNLSIAVNERKSLGALGIIKPISSLLDLDVINPVHFSCIGVLKNLCSGGNELNAFRIVTGIEPAPDVTKVAQLTIDS
ncbi:Rap1 GTPase-GDP dissociation stimulator 1, partial [Physocladia obscura]